MKAKFRITNQPTEIIYVTTQSGESVVSHHTKLGSVINYKLN